MHIVVLMTNAACLLDRALVDNLRNAMGGGDAVWLGVDQAAEFAIPKVPSNADSVWTSLQAEGVDMAIVPAEGRRKKLLIADMDSTMIRQECIDELADAAGVGERVAAITARAMNGELDFEAAIRERVGLLRDLPETVIAEVLEQRIALMPGGDVLLATMRANGAYAALVSGGFTAFTAAIAARLGFDEHHANILGVEAGRLTGEVGEPILGQQAKVDALKRIAKARGITPQDALAVGDGANDLGMVSLAGMGVALHAKPVVQEQARLRINHGDLTALLYLQGYARDEWVRP